MKIHVQTLPPGTVLPSYQTINGRRQPVDPSANYILVNGARLQIGAGLTPPGVPQSSSQGGFAPVAPAPTPLAKHININFDTIGQTIYRAIGHCRVPLKPIWALGVEESGDELVSNTQTFAAALFAPIDPDEVGEIFNVWDSENLVMNNGGPVIPLGWSPEDAALLATSIANIEVYPGNEIQLPASRIVSDKGASRTNAFRGLRYVIFPDYPIQGGSGGGGGSGLPALSAGFVRTSDGGVPKESDFTAVEFAAGAG